MNRPPDHATRISALDVEKSFIVQAPAGSGKTHLLVERYLSLIVSAEKVEQVVALTFTKKAADEMRQRVQGIIEKKDSPWAKKINQRNWTPSSIAADMRITTIDSFCNWIISTVRTPPRIHPQPHLVYERVVDTALNQVLSADDLSDLWEWTDGDYHRLRKTLVHLVQTRINWAYQFLLIDKDQIGSLAQNNIDKMRLWLNNELNRATDFLEQVTSLITKLEAFELGNLPDKDNISWHHIASWLLTKQGSIRAKPNKNQGFPTKSNTTAACHKAITSQWQTLSTYINEHQEFAALLKLQQHAPNKSITIKQKNVLSALRQVMAKILALLHAEFSKMQMADFDEILIQSMHLIQNDLTVQEKLYSTIKHMLVDECQDTSPVQFELIKAITSLWDSEQTLFMVGDPQQSIYQFRNADVRQFLKIQQEGFGDLHITPLYLKANFRSSENLVNHVNHLFENIFASKSIINLSMMPYHRSISTLPLSQGLSLEWFPDNSTNKYEWLCEDIKKSDPSTDICILVRQRQAAKDIIKCLEFHRIPYDAPDIFPCHHHPDFSDVLALTHALNDPYDLKEWYAVLTQKMTGMTFADISTIALQGFNSMNTECLNKIKRLNLSIAHTHIDKWIQLLIHLDNNPDWQIGTKVWQTLSYMSWLKNMNDSVIQTIYNWCNKLNDIDKIEPFINKQTLEQIAHQNFITHQCAQPMVSLMTVHHAKGLEFDKIYLPLFDPSKLKKDTPNCLVGQFYNQDEEIQCLIPRESWDEKDPHFEWLRHINQIQMEQEEKRLLYVALTRAKKTCVLIGDDDLPKNAMGWQLHAHIKVNRNTHSCEQRNNLKPQYEKLLSPIDSEKIVAVPKKIWQINTTSSEQCIGIMMHECLYRIWLTQNKNFDSLLETYQAYWSGMIENMGHDKAHMFEEIKKSLLSTLHDSKIQWILAKRKKLDHGEWPCQHKNENFVIDRLFLENDILHIVDYKYSNMGITHAHKKQLINYQKTVQHLFPEYPIKMYIYNVKQTKLHEFKSNALTLT